MQKKIIKVLSLILCAVFCVSLCAACGDKEPQQDVSQYENPVKSVMLNFPEYSFTNREESILLSAVVLPTNADNKNITWTNSDPNVASIDENGKVTPLVNGQTEITVTTEDGGLTATCKITVTLPPVEPPVLTIPVEGIQVQPGELTLTEIGQTGEIIADTLPYNATNKNIIWSVSDETVVSLDNGIVTALKKGTATVTATTEEGSFASFCKVTVAPVEKQETTPKQETSSGSSSGSSGSSSSGSKSTKLPSVPAAKTDSEHYLISDNLLEFNKINSDAVAWLYVPGTNMNFPVVLASDNEYYLDKGLDKKSKNTGSCYMDYRNQLKASGKIVDSNTILYGHAKGTDIFDQLENVTQTADWFANKNNMYICLNTLTERTVWQVFACYYTDAEANYYLDVHYYYDQDTVNKNLAELTASDPLTALSMASDVEALEKFMTDDTKFLNFMTGWRNRVDTNKYAKVCEYLKSRDYGVKLEPGDKVLTLSTCADASGPIRYVVQAKLIQSKPRG